MGDMTRASLVTDLKAILMDAAGKFTAAADADFNRHLDLAALDMARVRPRTRVGSVTLVADQPNYAAPADSHQVKMPLWGLNERRQRKPWERGWPGRLPTLSLLTGDTGTELWLSPSPSAAQISDLGSTYRFYYFATHSIGATAEDTTIAPGDRHLLLIRATAHALQELANNGVTKPVQLGSGGVGSMPKNGTPGALADALLKQFVEMAA